MEQRLSELCGEVIQDRTKKYLVLVCSKCTRQSSYAAFDRVDATVLAAKDGWKQRGEQTVCRKCPA